MYDRPGPGRARRGVPLGSSPVVGVADPGVDGHPQMTEEEELMGPEFPEDEPQEEVMRAMDILLKILLIALVIVGAVGVVYLVNRGVIPM